MTLFSLVCLWSENGNTHLSWTDHHLHIHTSEQKETHIHAHTDTLKLWMHLSQLLWEALHSPVGSDLSSTLSPSRDKERKEGESRRQRKPTFWFSSILTHTPTHTHIRRSPVVTWHTHPLWHIHTQTAAVMLSGFSGSYEWRQSECRTMTSNMNRKTILQQQKSLDTCLQENTSRKGLRWRRGSLNNGKQSKNSVSSSGTLTRGRDQVRCTNWLIYLCIMYNNIGSKVHGMDGCVLCLAFHTPVR